MAVSNPDQALFKRREAELQNWFFSKLPALAPKAEPAPLRPLSGDASFRRYFTSQAGATTYVLVDAPPEKENSHTFVQIAEKFLAAGINVPAVHDVDYGEGFMCLSYLGDTLLWQKLDTLRQANRLSDVNAIYHQAIAILLRIQGIREGSDILLPPYDEVLLHNEMNLFRDWFCGGIMGLSLTSADDLLLNHFFELMIDSALRQPRVCVHRDFHSRNLIYRDDGNFGVLDFQDAVIGPITYDLVSLVKDCYISWPKQMVRDWALSFASHAQTAGLTGSVSDDEFIQAFDLMGVQRHLKAIGIFSRLYLRDGKPGYLQDIPRTMAYIKEVLGDYPQMYPLAHWLEKHVYPMLWTRLKSALSRNQAT